jgi:hypothetical protein
MSRLYVRIMTSFYNHRKTLRLKARIGNDALWVVPKLWSYAAENQPDGDFSGYSPEEMACLIGYQNDPQGLLQGLLQAGFMDESPLRIHDWAEHNGYHEVFAERARKASAARWPKESPTPPTDGEEKEIEKESGGKEAMKDSFKEKPTSATQLTDEEWRKSLVTNPAYIGIDIEREFGKASAWISTKKNRKFTKKFFLNWLNGVDKPMSTHSASTASKSFSGMASIEQIQANRYSKWQDDVLAKANGQQPNPE